MNLPIFCNNFIKFCKVNCIFYASNLFETISFLTIQYNYLYTSCKHLQSIIKFFSRYLPVEYVDYVVALYLKHTVHFKIVKPRKTKLGDFRAGNKNEKHQITINNNLNKFAFLITTLHEFAHLTTYNLFGGRVAPHGKEWQKEYTRLIYPIIEQKKLPKDIESALLESLVNVKASSCSDLGLQRILIAYNTKNEDSNSARRVG